MIRSMTAFSRQASETANGLLTLELRSVNHRFSEAAVRLPEELRFIEAAVRERISSRISRGKIDCNLRYQTPDMEHSGVEIDHALIRVLTQAATEIEAQMTHAAPMKAVDLMRWPGVLKAPERDMEAVGAEAMVVLDQALDELISTREREGEQLKLALLSRCNGIEEQLVILKERLPEVLSAARQRLQDRMAELKQNVDAERLEQEVVLLANKSDIAEEIDRLETHIKEVRRVLDQDQPMGRRLDFLMQELNREANTIGSKSIDATTTQCSVELKVCIEQMREQVQNIE
jgi:uncharacterized protein (TIGR00255 family)